MKNAQIIRGPRSLSVDSAMAANPKLALTVKTSAARAQVKLLPFFWACATGGMGSARTRELAILDAESETDGWTPAPLVIVGEAEEADLPTLLRY